MDLALPLLATAAPVATYAASCFGEIRGIHDWLVPGAIFRVPHPHVVLTFDDGPDPVVTPRLLDVLARFSVKALFFVLGEQVDKHPELARRIVSEGHVIGNHSYCHPWLVTKTRARIESELDRCQHSVQQACAVTPTLVRPPYGQRDFRFNQAARARGLTPVLWSTNLRDYWGSRAERLVARLSRVEHGDIVLMHDGDPKATHTVEAVERWLATKPAVGLL